MESLSALASHFGVDKSALVDMTNFVVRVIKQNRSLFERDPDGFITAAVQKWHDESTKFYTDLINSPKQEFVDMRQEIFNRS